MTTRAKKNLLPRAIKPFNAHGADLRSQGDHTDWWEGDCLLCGKEKHLHVLSTTGQFNCKVCGATGNEFTFMTELIHKLRGETRRADWLALSKDRSIPAGILKARGLAKCGDSSRWLIPCFNPKGSVLNLRIYSRGELINTDGCKSRLFGERNLRNSDVKIPVYLCEGEWDAMALDWLLREAGIEAIVVALPGATTFPTKWAEWFKDRTVTCVFDADPAGDKGATKALSILHGIVKEVNFVQWPETSDRGYDLRDYISERLPENEAADVFAELRTLVRDLPRRLPQAENQPAIVEQSDDDIPVCSLEEVHAAFTKHVLMNEDMRTALNIMLAVCLSNDISSDPLWLYVVGPPGAGKTMMLQALSTSPRCVFRSTVTPHSLVSGWREGKDPSLIPLLAGRTFVVKDWTEILTLQQASQDEIFSTLRGAFDGTVRRQFGNGVMREYTNCRFSILAGVTHAIHGHKKASLGERFMKLQLRTPQGKHANAIQRAALLSIGKEREIEESLQKVVAGYLKNEALEMPEFDEVSISKLNAMVNMIAVIRAQVERDWREVELAYRPVPEMGTRLIKQLGKLGRALAFMFGEKTVGKRSMDIVRRVAFDTAYGFHLDIVEAMMKLSGRATKGEVCEKTGVPMMTLSRRFEDLQLLRVVERDGEQAPGSQGGRASIVYKVCDEIAELWTESAGTNIKKVMERGKKERKRVVVIRKHRR